ncbi:MAG: hypothetical protein K2P14_04090 [Anaeroplasmataceae bacterium]|nr:hypothetical protein [Anaeroplasmataceae bacterium]
MANQNVKLIMGYLRRFFEGPVFTKQKWVTFWRYAGEACSLVYEKMTGLDYSMVYYTKDESVHHSVYTKVPDKILRRIFADVKDIENKSFIDVGCGKCYAVTKAAQKGFKRYGGVEYTKQLYDTGISNLKKKGLSVEDVYNGDAKDFDHYGDFDVFFFNNPFDETIMEPVAKKIYETHIGRECVLYFLNPHLKPRTDAVEKAGFKCIKEMVDKTEWYFNINVYSNGG